MLSIKDKIYNLYNKFIDKKPNRLAHINLSNNCLIHPEINFILDNFFSEMDKEYVNRYPYYESIKDDYKKHHKITETSICFCAGTDLAIFYLMSFIKQLQLDNIIVQEYNYYAYENYAKNLGVCFSKITMKNLCGLDTDSILKSINPTFIFLVSPSSLTGQEIPYNNLLEFLKISNKYGHFVVLDHAYTLFGNECHLSLLKLFDNLIILHSFSKSYGVAGMRIGYLASKSCIINQLLDLGIENSVSSIAILFVKYILNNEQKFEKIRNEICIWRDYTQNTIASIIKNSYSGEFFQFNSKSNFIAVKLKNRDMVKNVLFKCLNNHNIFIKPIAQFDELLRFTVANLDIMQHVINEINSEVTGCHQI
jgi:histidinol-phosphate aminotransferase